MATKKTDTHTHMRISVAMRDVINTLSIYKRDGTKVKKATAEEKLKWLWSEYCRLKGEENRRKKAEAAASRKEEQRISTLVRALNDEGK